MTTSTEHGHVCTQAGAALRAPAEAWPCPSLARERQRPALVLEGKTCATRPALMPPGLCSRTPSQSPITSAADQRLVSRWGDQVTLHLLNLCEMLLHSFWKPRRNKCHVWPIK